MTPMSHSAATFIPETAVEALTLTPVPDSQEAKPQPERNAPIDIQMAPPSAADDPILVTRLRDIVNLVYGETEGDIFLEGAQRVNTDEMQRIIRAGELAVAYLTHDPATLSSNVSTRPPHRSSTAIGCMQIHKLPDARTGELGMFAIDPIYRGSGMGREMISFAESHCRIALGLTVARLELLVPLGFEHAFKKRLQTWYERMGYGLVKLGTFQEDYPQLAGLLRGSCEYRVFEKSMV